MPVPLPIELRERIIEHIPNAMDENSSEATLKAASLTCRATRQCSQQLLFSVVILDSPETCERLARVLFTSRYLANGLRHLLIVATGFDNPHRINVSLHFIFQACQRLTRLGISNFPQETFTHVIVPCMIAAFFPQLESFTIGECMVAYYDEFALVLSRMPVLRELRLLTAYIQALDVEQRPRTVWEASGFRLRSLVLGSFVIDGEFQRATLTEGFQEVEALDMAIKDWVDYDLLCDLVENKGVQRLILSVDWKFEEEMEEVVPGTQRLRLPDVIFSEFEEDINGTALQSIVLRQLAIGHGVRSFDGSWASKFLLLVPAQRIEVVCFIVHHHPGDELWRGFDWAAVDDALCSPGRFPALEQIQFRRDEFHVGCTRKDGEVRPDNLCDALLDNLLKACDKVGLVRLLD